MSINNNELIYSRQVLDFFTVANEFCIFIDSPQGHTQQTAFPYLQKVLPLLYLKGSLLPDIEPSYPDAVERYVTEIQWETVFLNFKKLFGDKDRYFEIDPDEYPPTEGSIRTVSMAEYIADIYQDMKDFVLLFSKELQASQECALSEIVKLFRNHWGCRLISLHSALHYQIYRFDIHSPDQEGAL